MGRQAWDHACIPDHGKVVRQSVHCLFVLVDQLFNTSVQGQAELCAAFCTVLYHVFSFFSCHGIVIHIQNRFINDDHFFSCLFFCHSNRGQKIMIDTEQAQTCIYIFFQELRKNIGNRIRLIMLFQDLRILCRTGMAKPRQPVAANDQSRHRYAGNFSTREF